MMKAKLIEYVKNNRWIYIIYHYVASAFVNVLRLFVKTDDKLILFVSYGGRHFNDSPKCLYDAMKCDDRYKGYRLVWAFRNTNQFAEVENKVKIDSLSYFLTALKARVWVTNVHIERGLDFTGKHTFYLHTTHTVLPKLMGKHAVEAGCENFAALSKVKFDCSCAQCDYEKKLQADMFDVPEEKIVLTGYPKNDILVHYTQEKKLAVLKKMGIMPNKKIILYAPTYRDENNPKLVCAMNFDKWQEVLGEEYVILFRAHPIIADMMNLRSNNFIKDVSDYPYNTDLMAVSDMLISDYSGIFFEYGVQEKPMFCYAYDYDEYTKSRKLYFDIRKEIPGGMMNEEELIDYIKNGNMEDIMRQITAFRNKYITVYGNATESCLNLIANAIKD